MKQDMICAYCGETAKEGDRYIDGVTGLVFHKKCYFKALKSVEAEQEKRGDLT